MRGLLGFYHRRHDNPRRLADRSKIYPFLWETEFEKETPFPQPPVLSCLFASATTTGLSCDGSATGVAGKDATMREANRVKLLGYRWVSNRGKNACPQCAALHGQVFLFKDMPEGQMPRPPLHPNCRCTREEILDFDSARSSGVTENEDNHAQPEEVLSRIVKPYMKDVLVVPGLDLIVRLKGSSHIPIWGKYCGPNWSKGKDTEDRKASPVGNLDPEDDMDAACAGHDDCYGKFDESRCDREFIKTLSEMSPDPEMWRNPPATPEERRAARIYRSLAIWLFKRKYDMEKNERNPGRGSGEEIYVSP